MHAIEGSRSIGFAIVDRKGEPLVENGQLVTAPSAERLWDLINGLNDCDRTSDGPEPYRIVPLWPGAPVRP